MDIKKQIAELQKKGFTKSQAGIIVLQQGGRILNDSQVVNLNKNKSFAGLEVVPEFGKSGYFITEEQQRQQEAAKLAQEQMLRAQQLSNITDITSDGLFTNRKVWHTQKPEWFVGKQQPIEGKDYTVVPYNQWGAYQTSPAYSTYMNKGKLAGMQQGGGFNANPFAVPQTSNNYAFQYPNINTTPYSYDNNTEENYMNRNSLPNFGNNGFQYNPNVVDTSPITTTVQAQVNPLSVDAGSGVSSYQEPAYAQNFNNFGGGVSLENSLRMFGQGLGEQDPSKTAMGGTLSALKLGRIGIGGYASGKENKRVEDEYRRKLYEDNRMTTNLQEGGEIKNSEVLTGQFAVANPNGANVIIEDSEFLKNNETGDIKKAVGEDHKNGGIPINLQDGKVLSDFTKIGAKNAKELKDRYSLSLKKTDTFAKVMDKVNKKIGIDKLTEEQAKAIEKLGDNEYIKDQTTKTLNEKLLTKQVEDSQEKLDALKGAQNFAFEDIFALQEAIPKKGSGELINEDGSKMEVKEENPVYQQGGHIYELAKKHNISPERAMELYQQGGETMPQEQAPQNDQVSQIIQAFAQATQQDPQAIAEQLQQLPQEEQQKAIEQMMAQLQQQSVAQGQQNPQEEQAEGRMSNPTEEGQEVAQQGGVIYAQEGIKVDPKYAFYTPGTYDLTPEQQLEEDYLRQHFVAGYDNQAAGGVNPSERVLYQSKQVPYLVSDSGIYPDGKVDLKNTGQFQQKWASYRDSVVKAVGANPYLSAEQKKNYNEKLTQEKFNLSYNAEKNKAKNAGGFDAVYGRETSEKGGFNLPLITVEDRKKYPSINFIGDIVDKTSGKVKSEYKDLDPNTIKTIEDTYKTTGVSGRDIGLGTVQGATTERPEYNYGQTVENPNPIPQDNTIGFQPYITPPSGRKGVILETVQSPQYDRIKRSFEAGESAIASQADTKRQQVAATGLAPQIQEAIMAGDLATSQGASNQNIASVEGFNAQNQQQIQNMQANSDFKTNLFNLGARDQYFVRNTQAADNAEISQKLYNDSYNRLGFQQQNDLMNRNLVNATSQNYVINADGTVTFKAPSSYYNNADNSEYYAWYDKLTPTDQEFERRKRAQETLDRANAIKKENASKARKF